MKNYIVRKAVQNDYKVGMAILVRIDTRGTGAQTVHKYAPITIGGRPDYSMTFEDVWGEVITLKEYRKNNGGSK